MHDENARPHTAAQMMQTTNKLGWELLPHPPNSQDLAPLDFHPFGPLKAFTKGTKFESDSAGRLRKLLSVLEGLSPEKNHLLY